VKIEVPDQVSQMMAERPGWALATLALNGLLRVLLQVLGSAVIITALICATAMGIAMMWMVPPDQYVGAAKSFTSVLRAFGDVASSSLFALAGWIVAAVVIGPASQIILVQRRRRIQQDTELQRVRTLLDRDRSSSQMTIEELLNRDSGEK
jgi:lysylphosphatidylglycerol synthetase-like protein (DUF2156 family)